MTDTLPIPQPFYTLDTTSEVVADATPDTAIFNWDSLWSSICHSDTVLHPSLFEGHELPLINSDPISLPSALFSDGIFFIFVAIITLVYLFMHFHELHLKEVFQMAFDYRTMERMLRETNLNHATSLLPIGLLYCVPLALLVNHYTTTHSIRLFETTNGLLSLLFIYAGIYLFYGGRHLIMRLFSASFRATATIQQYLANNYINHLLATILTLPLMLLLYYMPFGQTVVSLIVCCICIIFFLIRFWRGTKIILRGGQFSQLHFFYYLCIFEIVPLIVLYRVFISL